MSILCHHFSCRCCRVWVSLVSLMTSMHCSMSTPYHRGSLGQLRRRLFMPQVSPHSNAHISYSAQSDPCMRGGRGPLWGNKIWLHFFEIWFCIPFKLLCENASVLISSVWFQVLWSSYLIVDFHSTHLGGIKENNNFYYNRKIPLPSSLLLQVPTRIVLFIRIYHICASIHYYHPIGPWCHVQIYSV